MVRDLLDGLQVGNQIRDGRRHLTARSLAGWILPDLIAPYRHVTRTMRGDVSAAINEARYLVFGKRISIST
jgi:hypothetical protein